ncbi:hypothetical protein [Legionella waltersii]|uniref:Uncharacterized protein n=1 Tax=Legionella waltersii TaxID=66969 RepID=A0A0W1AP35_9GAMM|nr:hypothetical protein [Legionella waltersii]KTD83008.1 hypothetical protein Lwal_0124 [Legionella waltersii]SNV07601.1 Uncharacterised protein [Legionella waltersii]
MTRKIVDLLDDYNINCNLSSDDPILQLPLSLFKETEYADVITIVWFYEHNWYNPSKVPSTNKKMGEISYRQSLEFYNSVKSKVESTMKLPVDLSSDEIIINKSPASLWVNASQTTYLLCTMDIFAKMMTNINCDDEQEMFFKWILEGQLSTQDQARLESRLSINTLKNTLDAVVCNMARNLLNSATFQQSSHSIALVKKLLENLIQGNSGLLEDNARFFISVLRQVITIFPTPISVILQGLGIHIPDQLSPELAFILTMNIDDIPGLKDENWPVFIYCITLFLHQCAQGSPSLLSYSYAGAALNFSFESCTKHHTQRLLESLESKKSFYTKEISDQLKMELSEFNLSSVHPELLALLCFERCDPLKQLFITAWKNQQVSLPNTPVTALLASKNKFTLGETIYNPKNNQIVSVNKEDIYLIMKLKQLVLSYKSKASGTSQPFFATNGSSTQPQARTKEEYLQEFETLSRQISDPKLKLFLTIESIDSLHFSYVPNSSAVFEFMHQYLVSSEPQYPPTSDLRDLNLVLNSPQVLDGIILSISKDKLLVNLNDESSYIAELERIDEKIGKLESMLTGSGDDVATEETKLRQWWLEIQLQTWVKIKEMMTTKQEEADMRHGKVEFALL